MKDQFEHIVTRATILQNVDAIKRKCVDIKLPANPKFETRLIDGLGDIHAKYHGFLIDVWGVLHDGESLYPHALDCLENLCRQDKKIIMLSNAARRVRDMEKELRSYNILPKHYHAVLCSGELTWQSIRAKLEWTSFFGSRGYYLGPERSRSLIKDLEIDWVDNIASADFILNTGAPKGNPLTTTDVDPLLKKASKMNLPMICANPDQVAIRDGQAGICAGALARRYSELGGGQIQYHGKPYGPIYKESMALLGLPVSKVLAIGDAFETDIRGGQDAGFDTCLIASGIHRKELLPLSEVNIFNSAPVDILPTYACEFLSW